MEDNGLPGGDGFSIDRGWSLRSLVPRTVVDGSLVLATAQRTRGTAAVSPRNGGVKSWMALSIKGWEGYRGTSLLDVVAYATSWLVAPPPREEALSAALRLSAFAISISKYCAADLGAVRCLEESSATHATPASIHFEQLGDHASHWAALEFCITLEMTPIITMTFRMRHLAHAMALRRTRVSDGVVGIICDLRT